MFSYSDVANFIRQPEFVEAVEAARAEAETEHEAVKEHKGFIELLKQAVASERSVQIGQRDRKLLNDINLTPDAFFEVLFTVALAPRIYEAMSIIHEDEHKPRPHGFGDGHHNDPHCEGCLAVHDRPSI